MKTEETRYGSFAGMKSSNIVDENGASRLAQPVYAVSTTADGGTSTFINFVKESSSPSLESKKTLRKEQNAVVSVFPNPSNGQVTIKYFIPQNNKAEFIISDLSGRRLNSYFLLGENNQINIQEDLNSGIYLYYVVSNGRIVKQDKIVVIR